MTYLPAGCYTLRLFNSLSHTSFFKIVCWYAAITQSGVYICKKMYYPDTFNNGPKACYRNLCRTERMYKDNGFINRDAWYLPTHRDKFHICQLVSGSGRKAIRVYLLHRYVWVTSVDWRLIRPWSIFTSSCVQYFIYRRRSHSLMYTIIISR